MEKILLGIFLSNFLYSYVHASAFPRRTTESFIVHYLEDKRIVPVRVELNTDQQTEHVLSSSGGETLYDFNQGKVAYKDANSSQCFIADLTGESLEGDRQRLKILRNGIVRGFYLPTFIIQEEFIDENKLLHKFGGRLTKFCDGNTVSLVERRKHRRKRDTSGEKGQFTHHSYGHYGHQSNNYAHYGHETHITGSLDKDGQIRDQRVSHQQVRSDSSQGYPGQSSRNGPQFSTSDSTVGISSPQLQTQYQMPVYQRTFDGSGRSFGTGGSGQFSLQTAQESGYQLNLPLGLRAGNTYRGGIRSAGQYGVGGLQPQITTEYQKYPGSIHSEIYRPGGQTSLSQISPPVPSIPGIPLPSTPSIKTGVTTGDQTRITDRTALPGYHDFDQAALTHKLPGVPGTGLEKIPTHPVSSITTGERRVERPSVGRGTEISDIQTDSRSFIPSGQRQSGTDFASRDQRISGHRIPPRLDHSGLQTTMHPGPGVLLPGIQTPAYQPGVSLPGIQTPVYQPGVSSPDIQTPVYQPGVSIPGIQTPVYQPGVSSPGIQTPVYQPGVSLPGIQPPVYQPGLSVPSIHAPGTRVQTPLDLSRVTTVHETISGPGVQTPGFHPGMPSIHGPGISVPSSSGIPGQIPRGIDRPGIQTIGGQPVTRISTPSHQTPGIHSDSRPEQPYIPSSITPGQQFLQTGVTLPGEYGTNGDIRTRTQVPILYPPTPISGHPSSDRRDLTQTSQPVSTHYTRPSTARFDQTTRNGIQHPDSPYRQPTQRGVREEYPGVGIPARVSGIPGDSRGTLIRPGDAQFLQRGTGPVSPEQTRGYQIPTLRPGETIPESSIRDSRIPSRGIAPTLITSGDRRIITHQTGHESTRLYGQDSAASQTQIQTGLEGTAAEASAAGHYRGLGSQTQVQGGYVGNGSFSAQAQSGFTGGVVQSQVQGSKLGGLSGSSAQVERVGSAQSQVQVGQPSGAASSSAQGKFSGGITQVQAQSGKTGGSAGAQAQSTGLSSSHVQVNIGGNDVSERERFQGTVSASVQGGHSSGQSQTQLQGGYESGRTYVATAQGGFDSSTGLQVSVPPEGSLTRLSNYTAGIGQPSSLVSSQGPLHTVSGRPAVGSPAFRIPPGSDLDGKQISETMRSRDQIVGQTDRTHPTVPQPDQRHLYTSRLPQQQIPAQVGPQRTLYPPPSHIQGSRVQYPTLTSETQRPSHALPSPQITRYPYTGYPTDVTGTPTGTMDEKQIPGSRDLPGFRGYDQSGILPSDLTPGSPHIRASDIPGYPGGAMQPSTYLPGQARLEGQEGSQYIPGLKPGGTRDISYPSSIVPSWRPTYQQYNDTTGISPGYPGLSQQQPDESVFPQIPYSPTLESGQIPRHPSGLVPPLQRPGLSTDQMLGFRPSSVPGLETKQYPVPSHFPGQPQIVPPSLQTSRPGEIPVLTRPDHVPHFGLQPGQPQILQTIPSHIRPGETPVLTRPDHVPHFGLQPGQPQILPPSLQTTPSHIRPGETPVLTRPDSVTPFGLQPSPPFHIRPQQPGHIRPAEPGIAPRVSRPGVPTPSETTDITRAGRPGVAEPDTSNCCEALRDLQRRCCDRTSKKDGGASCCKSASGDEIFDFSSEDDNGKGDEPCKIVKAICYIVYKPVGKARICKPTQTNGC